MMRIGLAALAIVALLSACDDAKERASFEAACQGAEFSGKQCAFLYAMKQHADDDAAASSAIAGAAIGFSAVGGGKR